VESGEDGHLIFTAYEDLSAVAEALEATKLGTPKGTAIVWKPKSGTPVSNDDSATLVKLLDALDDDDDVSNLRHPGEAARRPGRRRRRVERLFQRRTQRRTGGSAGGVGRVAAPAQSLLERVK
jgi:hypothetical protein